MKSSIVFILALTFSQYCFAWGDLGHASVGFIAEKQLSPEGKKFINSIMGGEPLGLSAIWPDQVRDDERYAAFAPYHFFEIPDGTSYGKIPADKLAPKSADTILVKAPELLLLSKSPKRLNLQQKQIMMRYLIHVVGDVHQPLHIGNGIDRGGNLCDVKFPMAESGKVLKTNLHTVWDVDIVDYIKKEISDRANGENRPIKYFSFKHFAESLLAEAQKNGQLDVVKKQVQDTSRADWYAESKALHSSVYPDATPVNTPYERTFCKVVNLQTGRVEDGNYDAAKIPVISPEYIQRSIPIIKNRILLAGFRLAHEIEKMAKLRGDSPWTAEAEADFYKKVLPESEIIQREPSSSKVSPKPFHDWCHEEH